MNKIKWFLIVAGMMILAYSTVTALVTFFWMIKLGLAAACVAVIVIAYIKIKKFFK
jgi:hypothetical protein